MHNVIAVSLYKCKPCTSAPNDLHAVHEPLVRYLLVVRGPREGLQYLMLLCRLIQLAGQHAFHSVAKFSSSATRARGRWFLADPGWPDSTGHMAHPSAQACYVPCMQTPKEWCRCTASVYRCLGITVTLIGRFMCW